jgi:kynurenine formamidase
MRPSSLVRLVLIAGLVVPLLVSFAAGQAAPDSAAKANAAKAARPSPTLDDLASGRLRMVDLAWPLSEKSAYWPGDNYKPFELTTIATLDRDGVLSKAFSMPEHLGTHVDAPNHFERGQPSVDQIPALQLFGPGVVIDVSAAAGMNPDYEVSLEDIRKFEATAGRIPEGAIVLAYTGWSRFWTDVARYQGKDAMGRLHFPGFSLAAAQFLVQERHVRGIGLDTLSVDPGLSRDFPVHHALGKAGRFGLENLANLKDLPPRGFYLFVAPIKIATGSGGPARVFAIVP